MPSVTNSTQINPDDLRKYLEKRGAAGVNLKSLSNASDAGRLAREVNAKPDSSLWTKDEFQQLGTRIAALGGDPSVIELKGPDGSLTREGQAVEELVQAKVGRNEIYDARKKGKVLVARLDNMDWGQVWTPSRDAKAASPWLGLELFFADPTAHATQPGEEGVLLAVSGIGQDGKPRVSVARRGNLSFFDGEKEQLSIKVRGKDSGDLGDLKLLNCQRDPSMGLRVEMLNDFLKALGLPSRKTAPLQLIINNEYRGAYVALEDTDEEFRKRNFKTPKGHESIAVEGNQRGSSVQDKGALVPGQDLRRVAAGVPVYDVSKGASDKIYGYLDDLIRKIDGQGLSRTDEGRFNTDEYLKQMEKVLDVWGALRTAAFIFAFGSWDTMYQTDGNFEFHFDVDKEKDSYKATLYLTDLDSSFGTSWSTDKYKHWNNKDIFFKEAPGNITLIRNLLKNDKCRAYYLDCLSFIVNDLARPDKVQAKMHELWNGATGASVYRNGPGGRNPAYPWDRETVRRHVQEGADVNGWGIRGSSNFYSQSPAKFMEGQRDNVNRQVRERNLAVGVSGADFKRGEFTPHFAN